MRRTRLTLLSAALAIPAAALSVSAIGAQDAPALPGNANVADVMAGTYTADAGHSMVGWRVNHFGFNDYLGIFGDVSGTLEIDPANLSAAKVDVMIPIASVTVPSEGLKNHLLRAGKDGGSPDFFGPEPQAARFVSTSVMPTSGTRANIMGELTMNGVTVPVTVMAQFTGAGSNPMSGARTIGFEGEAFINRSDFGIDYALPVIGNNVALDISVAFEMPAE
ncbi:YceI family protein [Paraurantiacibacter namhicola]|uniref:Lipid/polyisoprenoid-binding YceI-like domain-containing protein n=1 Tax=Paraurantiacibacter namhicola TaxID=645517 RepID=A0A1C7D8T4_9SPHN|nr:YceI family protein [Paraurantiacibacter namhicola]ANU07890.1 hypothetical protein A6F65_01591 [Paraurantiacibacter namhicola]